MGYLLLLTVAVLFATTWLALFLSKLVTRPVAALGEATQAISRGRLDYRVEVRAADEIGDLVRSFNRMAEELEGSRRQIEASSRDLGAANIALEQRRRHIETILESIPTGVLSLDANRRITHVNQALLRIFHPMGAESGTPEGLHGAALRGVFPQEVLEDLETLLRRADRMGTTTTQMDMVLPRAKFNIALTVATLQHEGQRGLAIAERAPEVSVKGALHEDGVLHVDRPVEPPLLADVRDVLGGRVLPGHARRRVATGNEDEDDEHEDADGKEDGDHPDEAADDEGEH